jgi:hypothetical protein
MNSYIFFPLDGHYNMLEIMNYDFLVLQKFPSDLKFDGYNLNSGIREHNDMKSVRIFVFSLKT